MRGLVDGEEDTTLSGAPEGYMDYQDLISCLITSSPIPSHPSTAIIEETVRSVRFHLPEIPIGILCDGVRPEMEHRREDYHVYTSSLTAIEDRHFLRTTPIRSPVFRHQVGMLRNVMPSVVRPLILFLEHDTPLTEDPINWQSVVLSILSREVDLIRFLPEPEIHPTHRYLMCGELNIFGIHLTKTIQFSARPHLASKLFYNKVLQCFSPEAKCFVEDKMHGVAQARGCEGWADWKMTIFSPPGNKQRSRHTCGRENDAKFDDTQVF